MYLPLTHGLCHHKTEGLGHPDAKLEFVKGTISGHQRRRQHTEVNVPGKIAACAEEDDSTDIWNGLLLLCNFKQGCGVMGCPCTASDVNDKYDEIKTRSATYMDSSKQCTCMGHQHVDVVGKCQSPSTTNQHGNRS
jgi:hypothetical protein